MKPEHCVVCSSNNISAFPRNELRICNDCGLVFNNSVLVPGSNSLLERTWFEEAYTVDQDRWVRLFEHWKNRRLWRALAHFAEPRKKLLEIGIGSGATLEFLREKGFDVMGCDLSRSISRAAVETYGYPVHNCAVSEIPDNNGFDVVIMNHVLEHVNAPLTVLKDIRRLLKPEGLLYLSVPNIKSWEASLPGWTSYEPYHLTYFSPVTLRAAVEKTGFTVSVVKTNEPFSGWFLALVRTILRVSPDNRRPGQRTVKRISGLGHLYRLTMVCIGTLLFPLRWVQAKLGGGEELVLVARRY